MVQSIGIDFLCCPKRSMRFIASAGGAYWKCGSCFSHTEVKPTLTSTSHFLPPTLPQLFPHVLPQGSLPPGAAPPPTTTTTTTATPSITVSFCICQTNDPPSPCSLDKYSPSLPLSLSLLIYLSVSAYRSVSTGCLQF